VGPEEGEKDLIRGPRRHVQDRLPGQGAAAGEIRDREDVGADPVDELGGARYGRTPTPSRALSRSSASSLDAP